MTDAELAKFLGIEPDHPKLAAFMAGLDPAKRASYERMHELCGEIDLWQAGFGPKPTGVLIDMERPRRRKAIHWPRQPTVKPHDPEGIDQ